MPISSITSTPTSLTLVGVGLGGSLTVNYADIPGQSWNQNRLSKLVERVQDLIDVRIPLDDPSLVDDPDALVDPARADFFHEGGDLVSRTIIISDVLFDSVNDILDFTITKAR